MHKLLRWATLGVLACTLMGCSSLHLYDSAADSAATSAKADYDASKISDSIKLSRAVLDALDTKETEAFRSLNLAERNAMLLSLLSESGTSKLRTMDNGFIARFNKEVDERLLALTGKAADPNVTHDLDKVSAAVTRAAEAERLARNALNPFDPAFAFLPACNADIDELKDSTDLSKVQALLKKPNLKPKHVGLIPVWISQIKAEGETCNELIGARAALAKEKQGFGGLLGRAVRNTKAESDALTTRQKASEGAANDLKMATKAFADAQKAVKDASAVQDLQCNLSKPAVSDATTQAPAAAKGSEAPDPTAEKNKFCNALAKLKGLEDFGIKAVSEERLAQINAILGVLGGETPPADQAKLEPGLVLISTTSRFAQAWTQYQQAGKLPALEPLLIDKQLTTAQLAYAQAGVQLAESRVQYAQAYEDATLLEVRLLTKAKAEIGSLGTIPAPGTTCGSKKPTFFCASAGDLLNDKKLAKAAGNGGETANRRVYRALAYLSESYSVARDRQLEAELRLIDTDYRLAQSRSEASLASWDSLLSTPVNQLMAYHAGGIKPAEAASLTAQVMQALGVVGIAVRIK